MPLLFAVLILGGVFAVHDYQVRQAALARRPPPPPTVAVSRVRGDTWSTELPAVGSLTASAAVEVSGELPGKVVAIEFTSGQRVTKGRKLVRLDTSVEKAELKALRAAADLARLALERVVRLRTRQFAPQADVDAARARLDEALAQVQAKRAVIAKKTLRAPFAGRLGVRQVDLGQYLKAGTSVVTLTALDPIYADFTLPQRYVPSLQPGLEVEVRVSAYPQRRFVGTIEAVEPGLEASSRNVQIRAILANPRERLRPGMFARVRVRLPGTRKVLTVPDTAVVYRPYGDSVYVVEEEPGRHIVQLRSVVTGERRRGRVEITRGLQPGEVVVSAGQLKLHPGMAVQVDPAPAPGERKSP